MCATKYSISGARANQPFDDVRITLGSDGTIEVITGAASIGQGVETGANLR
jgi:CO/xanthine dehydrogenase Mo-binding subunit